MSDTLIVVGTGVDYNCDSDEGPRLALGLLSEEARTRWACTCCEQPGCIVWIEHYDKRGYGSTFALCEKCALDVLDPRMTRKTYGAVRTPSGKQES